ncbi:hypothetical protein B0H19DRAFT_1332979 [Mycena capillaripes]|nr:hypothetical protein B0H19DRAFT_1332979 [Mycena capillaripes]
MQRALERYDSGVTPGEIYRIDQLTAMRLADEAWGYVTQETIRNCWRKTGIIPEARFNPNASSTSLSSLSSLSTLTPSESEDELEVPEGGISTVCGRRVRSHLVDDVGDPEQALLNVMGQLEQVGVLQRVNMLDLEELVNMQDEQVIEVFTDEDIMKAVQAKHAEEENMDNCGNDENYVDEQPHPTRRQALEACSILRRFVVDSGDPFARQMETMLSRFTRQTRLDETNSLISTSITEYFPSLSG